MTKQQLGVIHKQYLEFGNVRDMKRLRNEFVEEINVVEIVDKYNCDGKRSKNFSQSYFDMMYEGYENMNFYRYDSKM